MECVYTAGDRLDTVFGERGPKCRLKVKFLNLALKLLGTLLSLALEFLNPALHVGDQLVLLGGLEAELFGSILLGFTSVLSVAKKNGSECGSERVSEQTHRKNENAVNLMIYGVSVQWR